MTLNRREAEKGSGDWSPGGFGIGAVRPLSGFGMAEIARSACAFAKRARLPQAEDSAPMRVSRSGNPITTPVSKRIIR